MKPILEIQHISKKFQISHETGPYLSLREKLSNPFRASRSGKEDFWALRDISFEVNAGESIGIIGKNGAGKSTLLKILSKITPPTSGKIISRGRIASLLEVGTGFHPELTGRENIFLNGSILGMKRSEIHAKFDEIIAFAGTERFLDTPLKHYSSGMQLRLAFAVAAFLEPEVLVIDEVLSVGDSEFQKKCIGKMEDVSKSGRTILFVSHSMSAIEALCTRAILLKDGNLLIDASTNQVIQKYLELPNSNKQNGNGLLTPNVGNANKPIQKIEVLCDGRISDILYMGCHLEIRVHFRSKEILENPILGIIIRDHQNTPIIGINNKNYTSIQSFVPSGNGYISMAIPYLPLFEGNYHLDIHFGNSFIDLEIINDCMQVIVEPRNFTKAGELPNRKLNRIFIRDVEWNIKSH